MGALIIKNVMSEGPGTIAEHLDSADISYKVVELGSGESAPSLDGFDTLIVLGGPMGVYEMEKYPHLAKATEFIKEAIGRGMKVLGVCLGAQLMANALGARVYKGHGAEVGWLDVELSDEGKSDIHMSKLGGLSSRFKVLQWHGDTFNLPDGAVRLAGSEAYPNQAFRFGAKAYALQFHVEVTRKMVEEWFSQEPSRDEILKTTDDIYDEYRERAGKFYGSFLETE